MYYELKHMFAPITVTSITVIVKENKHEHFTYLQKGYTVRGQHKLNDKEHIVNAIPFIHITIFATRNTEVKLRWRYFPSLDLQCTKNPLFAEGNSHDENYSYTLFCCAEGLGWDVEHLTCIRNSYCTDDRTLCPNTTFTTSKYSLRICKRVW